MNIIFFSFYTKTGSVGPVKRKINLVSPNIREEHQQQMQQYKHLAPTLRTIPGTSISANTDIYALRHIFVRRAQVFQYS